MKFRSIAAFLLAALLMFSFALVPAFAETDDAAAPANGTEVTEAPAEETEAPAADTAASGDDKKAKEPNWDAIITGGILLVAILVLVVLYFVYGKFNAWVKKFCRDYSSELKKIVWSPARDVKKNTVVVLVVSAFFAILIGVLDVIFSKGIFSLRGFIDSLR